ncbi:hypothetical protein Pint_07242 [Pistacia integerrima]|uniref:Uncharacterized protein n=1 Tax=Pistacia integerrima TaxID=434235 RepID=A0ACC0XUW6_9ROSI|nr:hypothetical protein Pint_07242 [Pistacia integerrima]
MTLQRQLNHGFKYVDWKMKLFLNLLMFASCFIQLQTLNDPVWHLTIENTDS